jgi:ADP-glucose pyrophosphorylase
MSAPIFTRPRFLPSSKINGGTIEQALISDGCIVNHATIRNSLVGLRSLVDEGTFLNRVVMMGGDYYESAESIAANQASGHPRIGIGRNCRIENAIIDKNARIGDNCVISPDGKPGDVDHPMYYVRDGIVIIPKNACIRTAPSSERSPPPTQIRPLDSSRMDHPPPPPSPPRPVGPEPPPHLRRSRRDGDSNPGVGR